MQQKTNSWWIWTIFGIGLILLSFSTYKANTISFTYDESSTVLEYAKQDYADIFKHASRANNHVLNTAMIKFFSSIFPKSEVVFRLPSLLSHVLYLVFSALLVKSIPKASHLFRVFGFIVLNFNPYVLDFFSVARGYGLAMGFTMGTIYFLSRHINQNNPLSLLATLTLSSLAVLSNFSWLNFHLAVLAVLGLTWVIKLIVKRDNDLFTDIVITTMASAVLAILIYQPIEELINAEELFFGGTQGVWRDTIVSLITKSYYLASPNWTIILALQFVIAIGLAFIGYSITRDIYKRGLNFIGHPSILIGLLVPIVLLGSILQHVLFDTRFLIERTALFLIPLFYLSFIFALSEFERKQMKKLATNALGALSLLFSVHTASSINSNQTLDWSYDRDTKIMMQDVGSKATNYQAQFGVSWPYTESCRFYQWLYDYDWLNVIVIQGTAPYHEDASPNTKNFDLTYTNRKDTSLLRSDVKWFKNYNEGETMLAGYSSQNAKEKLLPFSWKPDQHKIVKGNLFAGLLVKEIAELLEEDSIINVRIDATVEPLDDADLKGLVVVLEIQDLFYQAKSGTCTNKLNSEYAYRIFCKSPITNRTSALKIYFMNTENVNFRVTDFQISKLTFEEQN